ELREYNTMWKVMQASYEILNSTNPKLTQDCWLCYNIRPPFYEAIGDISKSKKTNRTNPIECAWKKNKETQQGITLSHVTGKGKCVG
ncbi:ENV2 protein, partial [Rhabdornis inornatus]|nr:ENV2 protein [Rhabdornis inornatus]